MYVALCGRAAPYIRLRYSAAISSTLVARAAGHGIGAFGKEPQVLFLHNLFQVGRDAHVLAQLLHGGAGGGAVFFLAHGVHAFHAHGAGNFAVFFTRAGGVVLHDGGQQNGVGHAVRRVVHSAQRMGHAVHNAKAHVREALPGNVLRQRHALAALGCVFHSAAQMPGDQLNGFQMEHVRHFPCRLCGVALDGVRQRVHARGGCQAFGHACHHIRVNDRNLGDIVGIHAHKLAFFLHIGDDVVDGHLGGRTCGGGHSNGEHSVLFGGGHALQAAHVGKLGVVGNDAHSLGRIHGRTAANGHNAICAAVLESGHAVLHVFNGGVGLYFAVNFIGEAGCIQQACHLVGDAELEKVRV